MCSFRCSYTDGTTNTRKRDTTTEAQCPDPELIEVLREMATDALGEMGFYLNTL
jgi:hypothetical protein